MMSFYSNADLFREAKEKQSGDREAYEKFFQATLKKFGADSPQDLDSEKRKEFFDYVNKNWKAQDEAKDLDESKGRTVKVKFSDGTGMTTSVAANMTDKDIKDYFKVGKSFNVGKGGRDKMAKVKSVEILESTIDEKMSRQLKDPKTEVMVVKNNRVKVIDRKDLDKYMKQGYELAESTVNEETVYIEYLNKAKGFKMDRKTFKGKNAYEDAMKWAEKNLGRFNPDMIKFESTMNEQLEPMEDDHKLDPMTGKIHDADAENKDGQRQKDKSFKRWHDAALEIEDHPYHENQDGSNMIEPSARNQTYAIENIVNKYLKDQD
jgi:hypothetical protein